MPAGPPGGWRARQHRAVPRVAPLGFGVARGAGPACRPVARPRGNLLLRWSSI